MGEHKLFSAFPISGDVIINPIAVLNSFPLNQKETIAA